MKPEDLKAVRTFVKENLTGRHTELDAIEDKPSEVYERFAESGLANWWLPEEYGGRGLGLEDSVEIVNEIAYGDAGWPSRSSSPSWAPAWCSCTDPRS
ncbi:acyl-CoA dehydrogenase family protein [Streptomyces sp. M19]